MTEQVHWKNASVRTVKMTCRGGYSEFISLASSTVHVCHNTGLIVPGSSGSTEMHASLAKLYVALGCLLNVYYVVTMNLYITYNPLTS